MPTLSFAVQADFDKVRRLRDEINRLEKELTNLGKNAAPDKVKELEDAISNCKDEMSGIISEAALAGEEVEKQAEKMSGAMQKVGTAAAGVFAVDKIKDFVAQIANVRGEFQQLEVAFNTMLGSADKAEALMSQLIETAATTPFGMNDIANSAKQLLAYGIEADKVNDTLVRLGDIAAGLSIPINDLAYLYGTTMVQGRIYTQDFNQFLGRGIPITKELASQFGVAESKVKELVEAGRVGFPEVEKAIISMTSKGSQFGGLMEAQSHTILGQISNLEDGIEQMMNNIGKANQDTISGAIGAVGELVENYQQMARIIGSLVGVYGAYKVAVMTVTAIHKAQKAAAIALGVAESALTAKQVVQTAVTKAQTAAQIALNKAMLLNPWVIAAVAVAGLVGVLISQKTETERVTQAEKEYNDEKQKIIDAEEEHKRKIEELISISQDESQSTDARVIALRALEGKYPDIFAKYKTEADMLRDILNIKLQIAEADAKGSITRPENEINEIDKEINEIWEKAKKRADDAALSANMSRSRVSAESQLRNDEKVQLKVLEKRKAQLNSEIQNAKTKSQFDDLSKVDSKVLNEAIASRERVLAKMAAQDKKYGTIKGVFGGTFTKEQLEQQKTQLISERNIRKLKPQSSKQIVSAADKEYAAARKALNDFLDSDKKEWKDTLAWEKKRDELIAKVEETKKKVDSNKHATDKDGERAAEAEKRRQKQEEEAEKRRKEAEKKNNDELTKMRLENAEKDIEIQDDSNEKILAKIRNNYDKRNAEIAKKARELAETNTKAGVQGAASVTINDSVQNGLTQEQADEVKKAMELNANERKKLEAEVDKSNLDAMRNYLKEYGTYEQQKLAITQEYEEKIAKATTIGDKMSLGAKMQQELKDLQDKFKDNTNWEVIFTNIDNYSIAYLEKIKGDIQTELESAKLSPEDAAAFTDKLEAVNNQIRVKRNQWKEMFGLGIPELEKVNQLEEELKAKESKKAIAQEELNKKIAEEEEIRRRIAELMSNATGLIFDAKDIDIAKADEYSNTLKGFKGTENAQNELGNLLGQAGQKGIEIKDATLNLSKAKAGVEATGEALNGASGAAGFAATDAIIHGVNQNLQSVSKMIDEFGLDSTKFGKGMKTFAQSSQYATDAFDSLKNGDIAGTVLNLNNALGSLGDALGQWGIGGGLFGESDVDLAGDIERLTASNKELQAAVSNLAEIMQDSAIVDVTDVYAKQKADLEKAEAQTKEMMARSAAAYSNGFMGIGGKGSSNKKIDQGIDANKWREISKVVGRSVRGAGDFFNLTSEQMAKVRNELPAIYSQIKQLADDGYADAAVFMDEYTEYYKQLQEIENSYREKLTSTSFDSIADKFKDSLKKMKKDANAFADSLTEMLETAALEAFYSNNYKKALEDWYKDFAEYLGNNGMLDESEAAKLKSKYTNIVTEAANAWNAFSDALGLDTESSYSQSASSKEYTTMSEDTGTEISGRLTAIQEGQLRNEALNSKRNESIMEFKGTLTQLADQNKGMYNVADEIRTIMANSYLELQEIRENTGAIVKPIRAIQQDIAEVKRNTSKL